ncbi:MAG: hypothetical protein FWF43_09025 [Propionibacteriaceae bacterium]|nr:hypothetical protein [Propionibacteriaceae bacterium]
MFIDILHFTVGPEDDDQSCLESLIGSSWYCHTYAAPFDPDQAISEPAIHGKWWRSNITVQLFESWSPKAAVSLLEDWADNQNWNDPNYRQSPETHQRMNPVFSLLKSGHLYKLNNPGPEHEHDWSYVIGHTGFHEFVAIDHASHKLHLIVATDD